MAPRSLNPDILPPSRIPLTPKERRRVIVASIIVLIALALLALGYWQKKPIQDILPPVFNQQARIEEEQLSIIRDAGVVASEQEQKAALARLRAQLKK